MNLWSLSILITISLLLSNTAFCQWDSATYVTQETAGYGINRCYYRTLGGYRFHIIQRGFCPPGVAVNPETGKVNTGNLNSASNDSIKMPTLRDEPLKAIDIINAAEAGRRMQHEDEIRKLELERMRMQNKLLELKMKESENQSTPVRPPIPYANH